jgi:Domain of unknown function (DUF4157)
MSAMHLRGAPLERFVMSRFSSLRKQNPSFAPVAIAPTGMLQRKCACGNHTPGGGECSACAAKRQSMQRSAETHEDIDAGRVAAQNVVAGGGNPLEHGARGFMEQRFGHDFSGVRVHTGGDAAASARAVHAHAYTVGEHIVFGQNRYAPGTPGGNRLLAHELTHVVQQRGSGGGMQYQKAISHPSDAAEVEADTVADRVMSGGPVQVSQAPSAAVQELSTGESIGVAAGVIGGAALLGVGIAALAGAFGGRRRGSHADCPGTHTIPDDVATAIDTAWSQSGHGTPNPVEHGGRMVTDSGGASQIRTGAGGSGSISLPAEQAGDTTTGTFHTHPYGDHEGSALGASFSGADLENFIDGGQGNVKYLGAGSCNFALTIQDTTERDTCRNEDIRQRYDNAFSSASGSFQEKIETAINASIRSCGLCYYKACRPDDRSPIPRTANLA